MSASTSRCVPALASFLAGGTLAICLLSILNKHKVPVQKNLHAPLPQDYACDVPSLPSRGIASKPEDAVTTPVPVSWLDGAILVARTDEDTSWLDHYLGDIPHIIYQVSAPDKLKGAQHRVLKPTGGISMAYLQFIIDYYDNLPKSVAFIAGSSGVRRDPWFLRNHVEVLRRLRWGTFNYTSLRYSPGTRLDWKCGGRSQDWPFREYNCNWVGLRLRPRGVPPRQEVSVSVKNSEEWERSIELQSVWKRLFQDRLGEPPKLLSAPCCSEFLVSRSAIRTHPKEFYVHLRDWLLQTQLSGERASRIFEYMWHYIFGEPAVIGPRFECEVIRCTAEQLKLADAALKQRLQEGTK